MRRLAQVQTRRGARIVPSAGARYIRRMKLPVPLIRLFEYGIADIRDRLPDSSSPVWDYDNNRQKHFEVQKDTRSILFDWLDNAWVPGSEPEIDSYRYAPPQLTDAVQAYANALVGHYGSGRVVKLFLTELRAGGIIKPHTDKAAALHAVHRCHLPIVSNGSVDFYIERVPHHLAPGVAYEFDNTRFHSVHNKSDENRVHLICDIMPEEAYTSDDARAAV
jgi:hypothetical protein